MLFIGLQEFLLFLAQKEFIQIDKHILYYIYPLKTLTVCFVLLFFRNAYTEISLKDFLRPSDSVLSILGGIIIFVLWVHMDWSFATAGTPSGYNPTLFNDSLIRTSLIISRLAGASIVVPVMEELFWRSFLIRYVINNDFMQVEIGRFTVTSFLTTVIFFGLEHNLWLAGMMAGIGYNLVLYRTKSIAQCILSHAVTNFALGLYVLNTGKWQFW